MAKFEATLHINIPNDSRSSTLDLSDQVPDPSSLGWTYTGHTFSEWNTIASGQGITVPVGAEYDGTEWRDIYCIWRADTPVDHVTVTYDGATIATLSESGTVVLATAGTYLTDDITIGYTA